MSEPSGNIKVLYYGLVQNVVGDKEMADTSEKPSQDSRS